MSDDSMTWRRQLSPDPAGLFSEAFRARWGAERWNPDAGDRDAAGALHVQLVSRITTQPLGYSDGDETTALTSLHELFGITRDICSRYPRSRHFDALAWHVLNTHVRPVTAKWHRRAEAGALAALDASDEFRAELDVLRPKLAGFDDLLLELRDGRPPPSWPNPVDDGGIAAEIQAELAWGTSARGGIDKADAAWIDKAEREAIEERRTYYGVGAKPHAVGLALFGGGIRSAIFSLGVLVALARRNILPQVDYLSTVSGGGYIGSFLTVFLSGDVSYCAAKTTAFDLHLQTLLLSFRPARPSEFCLCDVPPTCGDQATTCWWPGCRKAGRACPNDLSHPQ